MRALGEPTGSRRLTEEQNTAEQPEPVRLRPSKEGSEGAAADERTSPFPYAENFDEWVAEETAASDGWQDRHQADDADS